MNEQRNGSLFFCPIAKPILQQKGTLVRAFSNFRASQHLDGRKPLGRIPIPLHWIVVLFFNPFLINEEENH
jgi:hypothetical protein